MVETLNTNFYFVQLLMVTVMTSGDNSSLKKDKHKLVLLFRIQLFNTKHIFSNKTQ